MERALESAPRGGLAGAKSPSPGTGSRVSAYQRLATHECRGKAEPHSHATTGLQPAGQAWEMDWRNPKAAQTETIFQTQKGLWVGASGIPF